MTGLFGGHNQIRPGTVVAWRTRAGTWRGRVAALRTGAEARVEVWAPAAGVWSPNGATVDVPLEALRPFVEARVAFDVGRLEARDAAANTELYLYGDIGQGGGIDKAGVLAALRGRDDTRRLDVFLSSPGGNPFEGIAISDVLARWRGRSVVHIDGIAASAATLVAMAGKAVHISPDGTFMIHRAWTAAVGDRNDLAHTLAQLEHVDRIMAGMYARRTGMAVDDLLERMSAEWWMDADTARKHGFVDAIASPPQRNAGGTTAMLNRPWFAHAPTAPARPAPNAVRSTQPPDVGPGPQQSASASAAETPPRAEGPAATVQGQ